MLIFVFLMELGLVVMMDGSITIHCRRHVDAFRQPPYAAAALSLDLSLAGTEGGSREQRQE